MIFPTLKQREVEMTPVATKDERRIRYVAYEGDHIGERARRFLVTIGCSTERLLIDDATMTEPYIHPTTLEKEGTRIRIALFAAHRVPNHAASEGSVLYELTPEEIQEGMFQQPQWTGMAQYCVAVFPHTEQELQEELERTHYARIGRDIPAGFEQRARRNPACI